MNLKNYILEYVSSGRGKHIKNLDKLPDDFRELIKFIESLGYEEEYEFDVFTKRKVYFYMDAGGWTKNPNAGKWLYVKNPSVSKNEEILFMDIEYNKGACNINKFELQSYDGSEIINLKKALEYLRD